jgi:hypothetical protein
MERPKPGGAMRSLVQFVLVGCVLCAASAVEARERCQKNALEAWYCATDPLGTAVVDALGRVVCAPGECVRDEDDGGGWHCSPVPAGKATWTPEGPVCDGECRTPDTTDCKKI